MFWLGGKKLTTDWPPQRAIDGLLRSEPKSVIKRWRGEEFFLQPGGEGKRGEGKERREEGRRGEKERGGKGRKGEGKERSCWGVRSSRIRKKEDVGTAKNRP